MTHRAAPQAPTSPPGDGGGSGGDDGFRFGTVEGRILHSGPQADFEAHRSTLGALGTVTHLGADHGLASLYDVAGLTMMWSVLNAWLQGTALRRTAGVDAELPRLMEAMADRAIAAGHGAEQYPVLIEEFSRPHKD
ncbi:imine reductase family protein [Streptomyces chrestomyceticus]|uniref:imine reductase family protein n=1 Tax=Streptomyces chrestomyceticus TaxID=68185 RepID=UPI00378CA8B8